jgi:hypothetical protein
MQDEHLTNHINKLPPKLHAYAHAYWNSMTGKGNRVDYRDFEGLTYKDAEKTHIHMASFK